MPLRPGDIISVGDDWREWPAELWGTRDREQAAAQYRPLGEQLTPAPERTLPPGFRLFPGQRAPATKGERAVREIRNAKLGHR